MNNFADMEHVEWSERHFGYRPELRADRELRAPAGGFRYADVRPPKEIDWRTKEAVAPVKNQLLCGSCWAFSTTGSVEGINAIVTGELVSLSEQMLIDCDTSRDHGCHGGLMDYAYQFIIDNGGIDTEEDYPYTNPAAEGQCDINRSGRHVVTIDGYEDIPANDEVSLLKAVAKQPVSVAIEADQRAFQLYAGGVFDEACGTALNHGVLVVGYGVAMNKTHEVPYWIVKNSWGPQWGDHGYIRLRRQVGEEGQCGIAMQASFPVKKGPNPPEPPPTPPSPPSPPPGPAPVDCDGTTSCPADNTCCCMKDFFG
jgi:KDEL-tailed cysteine endopeptidase